MPEGAAGLKWAEVTHELCTALCPPGVRMVVLRAWAWDDGGSWHVGHQLLPVVAIQATVGRRFSKSYEGDHKPYDSGTDRELIRAGWEMDGQGCHTTALVLDNDYGLIAYNDTLFESTNTVSQLLCCPWPPAEDEARLAADIEELRATVAAREKAAALKRKCKEASRGD